MKEKSCIEKSTCICISLFLMIAVLKLHEPQVYIDPDDHVLQQDLKMIQKVSGVSV